MREVLGHAAEWVVAVHGTPVVKRRTVVVEWPEACSVGRVEVEELSLAAVKIPWVYMLAF